MPWEVIQPQDIHTKRWFFFDEERAKSFFGFGWKPALLFSETGEVIKHRGPTDTILECSQLRRTEPPFLERPLWSVATYEQGGVCLQHYSSEGDAKEAFARARRVSRVLFSPEGLPVQCVTHNSDRQGLGVAAAMMLMQRDMGGSVEEAIKEGRVPYVPPNRSPITEQAITMAVKMFFCRSVVSTCSCVLHPNRSLNFFDAREFPGVRGYVALTIDDAPCMLGPPNSMLKPVLQLLQEYQSAATFMLIGGLVEGHEDDLVDLLRDGHELGNHGNADRAYDGDSAEDFAAAVDACSARIVELQRRAGVPAEGTRWFRPPHARFSPAMEQVIGERGLTSVLCDTYACCPIVRNAEFVGRSLAKGAQDGSIILIHMPAKGAREWCYTGLEFLLKGLEERGLRAVTLRELAERADAKASDELRFQWMRDTVGAWSRDSKINQWSEVGGKWSLLQTPEAIVAALNVERWASAVKVRASGEIRSLNFRDCRTAAAWIYRNFVQEHALVLFPGVAPARSSSNLGEDDAASEGDTPARQDSRESGFDIIKPQRGDRVTEVDGDRQEHEPFEFLQRRGQAVLVKFRRRHVYLRKLISAISYNVPVVVGGVSVSPELTPDAAASLKMAARIFIQGKMCEVLSRVEAASATLGQGQRVGADWRSTVRDATDETVASVFAQNVSPATKIKISQAAIFGTAAKATAFVDAYRYWCLRQAENAFLSGAVEQEMASFLASRGYEVRIIALGLWLLEQPFLKDPDTENPQQGALPGVDEGGGGGGTAAATSPKRQWVPLTSSSRPAIPRGWLPGELRLGRELDESFFYQIGYQILEAAALSYSDRIDVILSDERSRVELVCRVEESRL